MRHRGSFKHRLKLMLSIMGLIAVGWALTKVSLQQPAQAKQPSIFDKGGGLYFGRGNNSPSHNVLPPIYLFSERPNHKSPYAIDPERVGVSTSQLSTADQHQLFANDSLYKVVEEGKGAGFIIEAIQKRENQLETEKNRFINRITDKTDYEAAYKDYEAKFKIDRYAVGELNQCIQSRQGHSDTTPVIPQKVSFETYKAKYPKCVSWLQEGYKFLRYSLVGVPQSQSGNRLLYEQKLAEFKQDTTKVVTVQKMTGGGNVAQYIEGKTSSSQKFIPDGMNTAINPDRNDVVGYRGGINESLAVVVWNKADGVNAKPTAQWILRLRCANPIGASLNQQSAKVDAQVKGQPDPVFMPTNGEAKVTFNYKIYKNLKGYAGKNTAIEYAFSGHNPAGGKLEFNPNNLKVTKVDPPSLKISSTLAADKISLDQGIPQALVEYKEEVTLNQANKNKVWYSADATSGYICRTVEAYPHPANNMPHPPRNNLKAKSTHCVKIKFGDPGGSDGTIYVFPLTPEIASITDPILADYKGINSYVKRNKQWSYWHQPGVSEGGRCRNSSSEVSDSLSRQCRKICEKDSENKIDCNKREQNIESKCCDWRCGRWSCWCIAKQYSGTAKCYHRQREQGAEWRITKMIFKPETNTTIENMPLSPQVDDEPCKHFKVPNGGKCETALSGNFAFDSTSGDFSLKKFKALADLVHTNITPRSGGLSDNVKPRLGGLGDLPYQVEALPSGTKVCFAASIYPWKKGGDSPSLKSYVKPQWRHSQPRCFVVSKKPFFAVENGMVLTGGNIVTNINSRFDNRKVGSWAEYNAISQGSISKLFATNSASYGGSVVGHGNYDTWHRLTFANQGRLGQFEADATSELIDPAGFFSNLKTGRYANTSVTTQGGGNISGTLSGVHVYNGNSTITGNISAGSGGNFGPLAGMNQAVIVVNGDLTINSNVSRIDAWLIVTGTLMTSQKPVTADVVGQGVEKPGTPLVINGPVKAGQIKLRRTYGSGIDSPLERLTPSKEQFTEPAETFRHTPQTYIWSYYNSLDKGQVQTVYLREVAPRY